MCGCMGGGGVKVRVRDTDLHCKKVDLEIVDSACS